MPQFTVNVMLDATSIGRLRADDFLMAEHIAKSLSASFDAEICVTINCGGKLLHVPVEAVLETAKAIRGV